MDKRKNQERCDRCGRWVPESSLVWADENFTKAICKKCESADPKFAAPKTDPAQTIVQKGNGGDTK